MNLSALQLPPPANWQDFETLCCDLWRSIWKDPNTQKNGRSGQPQHGVDISGRPNEGNKWAAVQCKGKDTYSRKELTKDELITEIEKAKLFTPSISQWTIATSGPKDSGLEQLAREITEDHLEQGLFSVHVWGWKDIVERLEEFPEVIEKNYPFLSGTATSTAKQIDQISERTQEILDYKSDLADSIKYLTELTTVVAEREELSSHLIDRNTHAVISEYQAELDHSRDLVNAFKYRDCIEYLEKLKDRIWSTAPPIIKFRILTNLGAAKYKLDQNNEAAHLFLEALQYNPSDEKALINAALAYLLLGQFEEAAVSIRQVLDKNPGSGTAYALYVQIPIPDSTLDVALSKVPEAFRAQSEVAYVLGIIAHKNGESDKAQYWLEKALVEDKANTPELRGTLGGLLVEFVLKRQSIVTFEQLNDAQKAELLRAQDLLTAAWDRVANTDLRKSGLLWLANRGLAKKLLGDLEGAIEDVDIALAEDPTNAGYIKHRAILAYLNNDGAGALDLLSSILSKPEMPETTLIFADVLSSEDRAIEAVEVLENLLKDSTVSSNIKEEANRALIGAHIKLGDLARATAISDQMRSSQPAEILNLTDAAEISRLSGKREDALSFLNEARKYITEKTSYKRLFILANEFYALEQFGQAAEIYEKIANKNLDTHVTRRLLNSYYRFGKLTAALEICQNLRSKHGPLPFITQIESTIYEEIDDFENATRVCEIYLNSFPDDAEMKLRLAVVNWRNNNFQELDTFLDSSPDIFALPLKNALQLAHLYSLRQRVRKCFEVIYELRRKFYDQPEAHLEYVRLFFEQAKETYEWLNPNEVSPDVAVNIEDSSGEKEWYVLEDRQDVDFRRREINPEHPLAQRILGKKLGEQVVIKVGLHDEETGTVIELKSKYLYALHDTFRVYEKMFPGTGGLWMFPVGTPSETGELPEGFQNIFKTVSSQQERGSQLEKFYNEGKLTLGSIANLLHIDPIKVWNTLRTNPDVGIRCAHGSIDERDEAHLLISEQTPKLAIDLISLLTIHGLLIADKVVTQFGKLLIAQRTIEELQNFIREFKGLESRGFMTIGKDGDQFVRTEISAAEVQQTVDYYEGIISWIYGNCEVRPITAALDIPRERKEPLTDMLRGSFLDTVLLAREKGTLLFSEDQHLRAFAKSEFNVHGVWTQILLMYGLNKEVITRESYTEAVLSLVCWHYYHTSIDVDVLLEAAKKADWLPSYPYTEVLNLITGARSDEESALNVTNLFLYELWKQPILPSRRDYLVYSLLDALTTGRDRRKIIDRLILMIRRKFYLLPFEADRLRSLIQLWQQMHVI